MSRLIAVFKMCAVLAVVVSVGILVGWLGTGGALRPPPAAAISVPTSPAAESPLPAPAGEIQTLPNPSVPRRAMPTRLAAAPELLPDWRDRVDEVLRSQADSSSKAGQLLQLFPHVPEEAQIEVAQYASNLMPDTNFTELGTYLTNSTTAESVLDVLFAGLLNRPASVKLPYLLALARNPDNPKSEQAHLYLQTFLDHDFGQDWSQWQASIDQYVSQPPPP